MPDILVLEHTLQPNGSDLAAELLLLLDQRSDSVGSAGYDAVVVLNPNHDIAGLPVEVKSEESGKAWLPWPARGAVASSAK